MISWSLLISCKSSRFYTSEFFISILLEGCKWWLSITIRVIMTKVCGRAHCIRISSVKAMLNLHTCIFANLDMIPPSSFLCEVVFNSHKHVESLIGFLLTILNTSCLFFVLWSTKLEIDTVFVALFEKNFRKSILLQRSYLVVRISSPRTSRHYFD